jgi:microcystin-dependent protein
MALLGAQFVNAVSPNPVGSLQAYAGASAPTGWLLCDGTSYSTSVYPELYSVLGYTYGGSGSNFSVPDLRGRVPMGAGTGAQNGGSGSGAISGGTALTARTRGGFGGDERMQTHKHYPINGNTNRARMLNVDSVIGHPNGYDFANSVSGGNNLAFNRSDAESTGNVTSATPTGSGGNMPPFVVTTYIIKAVSDAPRSGLAYGSTPPIVTALPANPQFGDVVTYIADATNGVAWNLQYDATGTYPWKFVGGGSLFTQWTAGFSTSSTGWTTDTAFTGFSIPLAGDYLVTSTCLALNTTAFQWWLWRPNGCSYPTSDSSGVRVSQANNGNYESATRSLKATLTTGTLNAVARVVGANGTFIDRSITAIPVRVA